MEHHSQFSDLPIELVYSIFLKLERNTLLDVACTSRFYNNIATEVIWSRYEFDQSQDLDGTRLREFIAHLQSPSKKYWRRFLRSLTLKTDWYDLVGDLDGSTTGGRQQRLADATGFYRWVSQNAHNLETLQVAYESGLTFLADELPARLESLIVRPAGRPDVKAGMTKYSAVEWAGGLDVHFLPAVLRCTSLKRLDVGAVRVMNDGCLLEDAGGVPVASSSIEHLTLKVGEFSDEPFLHLLRAPRALKSFAFTPVSAEDIRPEKMQRPWTAVSDAEYLPPLSSFAVGLNQHAPSLESLKIYRGDSPWHPKLQGTLGSLATFTSLKHLKVDATMLLGWNHCAHIKNNNNNPANIDARLDAAALSPSSLASLLPPTSLETLTLTFEDHHCQRNGTRHALAILEGLLASRPARLAALRLVTFNFLPTLPYCTTCDDAVAGAGAGAGVGVGVRSFPDRASCISIQEARALQHALATMATPPFEFRLRNAGYYWDETDPSKFEYDPIFDVVPGLGCPAGRVPLEEELQRSFW